MRELGEGALPFQSETALSVFERIQSGIGEISFQEIRESCEQGKMTDTEGRELAILLGERIQGEKAKMRELAEKDSLTGLYNHRFFRERGLALIAELNREQRRTQEVDSVAVLIGDVNHLKEINDKHGHLVGDHLLVRVAQALKESIRDYDVAIRHGGDEFALILVNADQETVEKVITRIKEQLSQSKIKTPEATIVPSISLGYSLMQRGESKTLEDLVAEADANMYQEKRKK